MATPTPKLEPCSGLRSDHADWSNLDYLVDALAQFERQAVAAEGAGSWGAATLAKKAALAVRADIETIRQTEAQPPAPVDPVEHARELLAETRRMRIAATSAQSYVAATSLMKLEQEQLHTASLERKAAAEAELAGRSEAEIASELVELLRALPPDLRAAVVDAVRDA
jgi:hypothetical protein